MRMDGDRLYTALPAYLHEADLEAGGAVEALFGIMGGEADRLGRAIDAMAESWFIETCPEWAVPYIADLLAVRALTQTDGFSERAWVAQTVALRRRKGTLGIIGTLTRATTGWPALPVEMFQRLATTQSLSHLRPGAPASALVREPERMRRHDTAFDALPHTLDIRSIARGQGRYNVPNIGIFGWRQQVYPLEAVEAAPAGAGRFLCDPAGRALPLWNPPGPLASAAPREADLPALLDRRTLYLELEALRADSAAGRTPAPAWFDDEPPLRLWVQDADGDPWTEIPREELASADLHDVADARGWRRPPASLDYPDAGGNPVARAIRAAFDPVRGRIAFPDGIAPHAVHCSHALAAPGDLGAGPYDRTATVAGLLAGRSITWQVGVSRRRAAVPGVIFATVAEAVAEWNTLPPGTVGAIALLDNDRFDEDLSGPRTIVVPQGSLLLLVSADWPETPREGGGSDLLPGSLTPRDRRAAITGNVAVAGSAPAEALDPGALVLDGLLVGGAVLASPDDGANLGELVVSNCTVLGGQGVTIEGDHERLTLTLRRSVCTLVSAPATVPGLEGRETVVLGPLAMPGARASLAGMTVTGLAQLQSVSATDTIFARTLIATRRQVGCLRFSYVPPGSSGPRQFRCQPDLAIKEAGAGADAAAIAARLGLAFDTLEPGAAGFARLSWRCDPAITAGAESGGAMGVWRFLEETQRRANLDIALDEYLGLGLEAGLIPAS
ncbi:hypothetical protein SAMN05518801_101349 [Novosphingobium sp. CF614]|nr:hypothetical protein SAMN05518801_101349 [Novosphingobium sp. CF614]